MKARARTNLRSTGFTLIELMITVAVLAIIVSVAYPSYQDHVRKGHRAKAQALLMDMAMRQSQRMMDVRSYTDNKATLGVSEPPEVSAHYTVTITVFAATLGPPPTPPRFTVTAVPSGSQTKDKCGQLSIDQAGSKNAAVANCW